MELLLNLAWTTLAALMIGAWLRCAPRTGADKRKQLIALAALLLILFPVISVTDDLVAVQNVAETDSCQRRNSLIGSVHLPVATIASLPDSAFSGLQFSVERMAIAGLGSPRVEARPELAPIANRPPPEA